MGLEHSWKWLPPRFKGERVKGAGRARACLPALEPLDDRLLLSTAGGGDPGIIAVLIGLLRNEINVRGGELDAMKIAAGGVNVNDKFNKDEVALVKLQGEFKNLDMVLDKSSVDAVHGGLSTQKVRAATVKINEIFIDIGKLLPYLTVKNTDGEGLLLPAVQKVREAALGALDAAAQVSKIKLDGKVFGQFIQAENDLVKIDGKVLRYSALDMKLGPDNKAVVEAKFHIAGSFDKLEADLKQMGDGSVFKVLQDDLVKMKIDTLGFLNSLPAVQTPGNTATTGFAGFSLDNLGDLISG